MEEEDPRMYNPFYLEYQARLTREEMDRMIVEELQRNIAEQKIQEDEYNQMLDQVYQENLPLGLYEEPPLQWHFWQRSDHYHREGNVFTKLNVDFMKFVHAQEPLPPQGIFVFQLRVIVPGTVGFGIATGSLIQESINQQLDLIDSRWQENLFLCTFSNGQGLINVNGYISKHRGRLFHVGQGKFVNMIINMSQRQVIFVKEGVCTNLSFKEVTGDKHVFPFFQLKNIGASVEVKQL